MEWLVWLGATLFSSMCMSFFSTQEMACISYNRLKLEMQARSGFRRAKWIQGLLQKPTSLFATTLVGVNLCLVITSECMRQLFTSLSWNPNLSVFLLVPYLVLFGELVPMFAARTFPEHTAQLGAPIIWFFSLIVSPIAQGVEKLFVLCCRPWLTKKEKEKALLFQHEELQELLRPLATPKAKEEDPSSHLFFSIQKMRDKTTASYMTPLSRMLSITQEKTAKDALARMKLSTEDRAAVWTKQQKVVGIITVEELLAATPSSSVQSLLRPVSLVREDEKASQTLAQMIREEQEHLFVINKKGDISGTLTIDSLLEDFLPKLPQGTLFGTLHIAKTIDADQEIGEFFRKYDLPLPENAHEEFNDYIMRVLDRKPKVGEKIILGPVEITVKKTSLRGVRKVFVQSL